MVEVWKDIKGYEGKYQISNLGNAKSLDRITIGKGVGNYRIKGKSLKKIISKQGYISYRIGDKLCRAHRLVALNFIPIPEAKPQVNHLNAIKSDNRAGNLEWVTPKENMKHAYLNNLVPILKGERCGASKLKEWQVREIRNRYANGNVYIRQLAKEYGVGKSLVAYIVKGEKVWKHIA